MNTQDQKVVKAMRKWGGGFIKSLADAAERADSRNLRRIKEAWSDDWARYARMVRKERRFRVPVTFSFAGDVIVTADSSQQAEELVGRHVSLVLGGDIHSTLQDVEWKFLAYPEKRIAEPVEYIDD